MQLRLRSLLEDRFKLDARREVREMPIYALVVARSDGPLGLKMKTFADECAAGARARAAGEAAPPLPPGSFMRTRANNGRSRARRSAGEFRPESRRDDRPFVIDKTGLTGPFDLDLQWTPTRRLAPAVPRPTACHFLLHQQLGLRLEAQRPRWRFWWSIRPVIRN